MELRIIFFLLFLSCNIIKINAQTVGVYGCTFFSGWRTSGQLTREFMFGPSGGFFINGFLKGNFNPGIDIQYTQNIQKLKNHFFHTKGYPFYSKTDSFIFYSDVTYRTSITAITLDLEFTSNQNDTLVLAFSLQPAVNYMQDNIIFDNPKVQDLYLKNWSPSIGFSGTIRRNYLFNKPLQAFISISCSGYSVKNPFRPEPPITTAFEGSNELVIAYAKIGLAYKFK